MQPFDEWLETAYTEEPEKELPEGITTNATGRFFAQCCVCEKWTELPCDVSEIPETGYSHYCGGNPWCCP